MIEAGVKLARLLGGLGSVELLGYGVLACMVPFRQGFTRLERAALSFGMGALVLTLWMLALTSLGVPFSLPLILLPPLAFIGGLWLGKRMSGRGSRRSETHLPPSPQSVPATPWGGWEWMLLVGLGALFLYAASLAMFYPMCTWDAVETWGYKARVFYLLRAVDLSSMDAHNYYPNLVPLLMSFLYLCLGGADDQLVKGLFPLWGAVLLTLLYALLLRSGLGRRRALGVTAVLALNGVIFIEHLSMAYADLALAYFALGAAGLCYLWLAEEAPPGSLPLLACFMAGLAWCKFEGPPLAATIILAGLLTLLWLRPPLLRRRLRQLIWPLMGLAAGYLPWRLFMAAHNIEIGRDHILGFYPHQFWGAIPHLAGALFHPYYFGFLWPAVFLAFILAGKRLWTSPFLFLTLFILGNLLAVLLAYGVAPTSPEEFPRYVRATLDRLLLHLTPAAALLVGLAVKDAATIAPATGQEVRFPKERPPAREAEAPAVRGVPA